MKTHEKIKKYREKLKLSQEYITKYLSIDRNTYIQFENGRERISDNIIIKLCVLFGLSLVDFIDEIYISDNRNDQHKILCLKKTCLRKE